MKLEIEKKNVCTVNVFGWKIFSFPSCGFGWVEYIYSFNAKKIEMIKKVIYITSLLHSYYIRNHFLLVFEN